MSKALVKQLVELRERVERLENRREDDGYWTTIKSVDAATASVTTAEGRKVPIWSMSSRLVIQPVSGDQCLVLRGLAVCGVRPYSAGEADGDVDMIRDVLRHDRSSGEVGLGASPSGFVALAQKVDDMGAALLDLIETHVHLVTTTGSSTTQSGTTAVTTSTTVLQTTAAEKVKAQ